LFLAGLLLGFFFFPASIPLSVPVRLEFTDAVNLYCDQTTRLVAIRVKNGQCVDQGDLLLEMRDPEIDLAISQANQQRRQLEIDIQKHRVMLNADQTLLLQRQLDLLNEEIARLSDRKQQLNIFAPTSGTVIESEPRPASAANDARLPKWDGSPLSPMNLGCQVNQGTLLLSIATRPVFRGVLRIDQLDIHSIQVGQTVRIKLDHLPFESFDGRVEQIFRATGGESVAMAGKQPVDPDQLPPFQAIVSLTGLPDHCLSGMNGRAKVNIAPQTAAGWLWKHVKSIFNFQS
jgi:multidrug resistance efflux pump